ncbi:MAG: AraC family transcriptional regulator [Lachnospiraceae bacterium]|nr:AraC family transcriptional regulator [Lachnospiraceae bacterium]
MSHSICKFMPAKNYSGGIKIINYVYETEFNKLRQPFLRPVYYVHLVTRGAAVLKINGTEYELKRGSLFFAFPGCPYEIAGSEDFGYLYISFMGSSVATVLEDLDVNLYNPVYYGLEDLIEFWQSSIKRINQLNANLLSESVLLYTLSFINNKEEDMELKKNNENLFDMIVDYVDNHYKETDMSLKKIADMFSYTEKYLSSLFKKNMNVGFNQYLNRLRIQYAIELIANNVKSVSRIAELSGYSDSLYFSKVFKKLVGVTPGQHIKDVSETKKNNVYDYTKDYKSD